MSTTKIEETHDTLHAPQNGDSQFYQNRTKSHLNAPESIQYSQVSSIHLNKTRDISSHTSEPSIYSAPQHFTNANFSDSPKNITISHVRTGGFGNSSHRIHQTGSNLSVKSPHSNYRVSTQYDEEQNVFF